MPISEVCLAKPRKVLIITSSGGGGLLQAANAKEQELKAKDPNVVIVKRDIMQDWMWAYFGRYCVSLWNRAQLRGDVKRQRLWGTLAPIGDYLFRPYIFFGSLYTLFREDIDQVIDTQIMGTSSIIKALRWFNYRRKKKVYLEKVLVDLPTKKATHFFVPIRSLSDRDRQWIRLITIAPLLEKGQTEEEFWKENCNLTAQAIQYEDYYVRQSFICYRNLDRKAEPVVLRTRFQNEEELSLIEQSISKGAAQLAIRGDDLYFPISSDTRVFTLLLGSQPANHATINYVKKFIQLSHELKENQYPTYLYVFCSNHVAKKNSLFKKVSDFVAQNSKNSLLTVIPMSFQSDDVIAPLFFRSDVTCTRSGGQTAMELMTVSRGSIWIHSEAKGRRGTLTDEELLDGIPGWESANALYLQSLKGAKIVTTETFISLARELIQQIE